MQTSASPFLQPSVPARPSPVNPVLWLPYLFLRPRRFFESFPQLARGFTVAYSAWIVGIAGVLERLSVNLAESDLSGRDNPVMTWLPGSWVRYWSLALTAGAIGGLLYFSLGGWWYRKRLQLSGLAVPDVPLARRVYLFASLVWALPALVVSLWDSFWFPTPLASEHSNLAWDDLVPFAALAWSVYVSYRGVRVVFEVVRWKARMWFLVLPALLYGLLVVGVIVLAAVVFFLSGMEPDVRHPQQISRPAFTLQYPGNWWVADDVEDYEPDAYFQIEPIQDAGTLFIIYQDAVDADEQTQSMLAEYQELYHGGEPTPFTRWGAFDGSGLRFRGNIDGDLYDVQIFTASEGNRGLTVVEWCWLQDRQTVEPGLDLMRRTFRWRP